ncbi:MAG: hypothetical protein IJV41_00725 [Oscillospiraceae bacterium]|nr:hypothetical protein [Oscillospiraceae bacterium]
MNYTEHTFHGRTWQLSLTAGALYQIYEKYGYTTDIVGTLKLDESSLAAWDNICWLYALLASQGELQRRALGYDPAPMLPMEDLLRFASPADLPGIKSAIYAAIRQGFTQTVQPSEDDEVDLVLQELEQAQKKTAAGGMTDFLSSLLAAASSASPRGTRFSSPPESSTI